MATIYCPECGHENDANARFCENCGRSLNDVAAAAAAVRPPKPERTRRARPTGMPTDAATDRLLDDTGAPLDVDGDAEVEIWRGRPSKLWSPRLAILNRYRLTNQRLRWEYGFISRRIEEVDLFRVNDVGVNQPLTERLRGFGDITVYMSDASSPDKVLQNIPHPDEIKDLIRTAVRRERQRRRVMVREDMFDQTGYEQI